MSSILAVEQCVHLRRDCVVLIQEGDGTRVISCVSLTMVVSTFSFGT